MEQLPDLAGVTVPWWRYLLALAVVITGFVLSRYARRGTARLLARTRGIPEPLSDAAARFTGYLVIFLGFGVGLAVVGVNVQPILATVLVIAVIAALVLKGVADNFAAGVLLQTSHPVAIGDEVTVEIADGTATGVVEDLRSRVVVVRTYDGRLLHVPNASLMQSAIVVTPAGQARRGEVQVRLDRADAAPTALLHRVAELTATAPGVKEQPAPTVFAQAISPTRVTARVTFWHDVADAASVTASVVTTLAGGLESDGRAATVTSTPGTPPLAPPDAV